MNPLLWASFSFWILAKINNTKILVGGCGSAEEIEETIKSMGYCPYEDGHGMPRLSTWFRAPIVRGTRVVWLHDDSELEIVGFENERVEVVSAEGTHVRMDEQDFRMNTLLPVEVAARSSGMSVEELVQSLKENPKDATTR